jgi:hypothetical protein
MFPCIVLLLIGGIQASTIVPVFIEDSLPKVRLMPLLLTVAEGHAANYFIDTSADQSCVGWESGNELANGFSFYGGDGESVVTTIPISLFAFTHGHIPVIGVSPQSEIYENIPNGIVMVPGILGDNFPPNTQLSMVLNPENFESHYCVEGSLITIRSRYEFEFVVETYFVSNGDEIHAQTDSLDDGEIFKLFSKNEFDHIPEDTFNQLIDRIGDTDSRSTYIVENCNMEIYPSILFRIGEYIGRTYRGDILYTPEDYLEQIPDTNQCALKVRPSFRHGFGMNFLSKIAVHMQPNQIGLCDPAGV